MTWLLRLKRELGLVAPEDGLCTWTWDQQEVTTRYDRVTYSTTRYKCVLPWHHGSDHDAPRVTSGPS